MKQEMVLPKNIRQIGEIQQDKKIYLEDYVMTYIRKKEKEGCESCAGVLFGKKEQDEQGTYLFLTGALLLDQELDTKQRWEKIEEEKSTYFPDQEMWGYFLIGTMEEEGLEEITKQLSGTPAIIFHIQEGEENVYWSEEQQYHRLKGYFVFYERNPQMQKYMAESEAPKRVEEEEGVSDKAIVSFRKKVKEKTQEKRNDGMRYLASSFLMLTIFMLGVTIVNNYDRMKNMEKLIEQISLEQQMEEQTAQVISLEVDTEETTDQEVVAEGEVSIENQNGDAQTTSNAAGDGTVSTAAQSVATSDVASTAGQSVAEDGTVSTSTQSVATDATVSTSTQSVTTDGTAGVSDEAEGNGETREVMAQIDAQTQDAMAEVSVAEQGLAERNYSAEDVSQMDPEILGKTDEILSSIQRQSQSVYTIRYGDTLADISQKYYGSLEKVQEICEINEIDDANMIVPGQKIVLP